MQRRWVFTRRGSASITSALGVLSCPDLALANVAARTRHIRLAPAVNVGLKPHLQVKNEMARFMTEVAPAFAGSPA
jgi:hypothetical protein